MSTLYFLSEAAATYFESVIILLTLFRILDSGFSKTVRSITIAVGGLLFSAATMGVEMISPIYGDLPDLIIIVLYISFSMIVFKSRNIMKLLVPVALMIMILIINISVIAIMSRIWDISIENFTSVQNGFRILSLFVTKILFMVSAGILSRKLSTNEPELSADEWIWLTAISVFSSVMLFIVAQMLFFGLDKEKSILMLSAAMAFINIGIYVFADRLTRKNRELYELKMMNVRADEQLKTLHSIEDIYSQMRILRHDMKNQWIVVNDALKSGDTERARQTAAKVLGSIDSYSDMVRLNAPAISAVLNYKLSAAKAKNIRIVTSIHDCFGGIEENDIVMLLANLVDNAIEASKKVSEPQIELITEIKRGYLNIVVSNRIEGSVLDTNPKLITSKPDKLSHGLGLRSVRQICEKYGGSAEYYEDGGRFVADILLKIKR
ncbi:GHKL domain-containing protein [Ruminococcus sp. YE71]|uniref:sensor histidine kinase n=1 Tax=unclassified Ruminococcus TaxID=2608920 RepID=UPI000884DDA5|nr:MULTISPECIES: sensor histidine kinase [unclassified Ruminococcus]SDA20159.1 GHKL domain-containing protein [Ruminococcus sp. YE78]SFW31927.1 GHKL domain-containing protein [Ruminococcus sp. YE71]